MTRTAWLRVCAFACLAA